VFSDLHIQSQNDPMYRSFCDVLSGKPSPGDYVVLAGDIFDLFVGDKKAFLDRYSEFFLILENLMNQKVRVDYIEGNHDFQLDQVLKRYGVHHHDAEVEINLEGKKFYIAHGDLIDEEDRGYRLLRGIFRSKIFSQMVKLAPGAWIDQIGQTSSKVSRKYNPMQINLRVRGLFRDFALTKFHQNFDYIVLGHCHDLDETVVDLGGRQGQYINMGFPKVHGFFLSWKPGEILVKREQLPIGKLQHS